MSRARAEGQINDMRQRMIAAGMQDAPVGYAQAWDENGNIVRDYKSTVEDLQTKYESFVRDGRLKENWGNDYQSLRIGKSQMTAADFEKRVLDLQQQTADRAYVEGKQAIASGVLPVKDGDYIRTLGTYVDRRVPFQLRGFASTEEINESSASKIWAINRSMRNDSVDGWGVPDNRIGYNVLADTSLARKSGYTDQVVKWNALRPNSVFLIIRPNSMPNGGSYVIPRASIQPYMSSRFGKKL